MASDGGSREREVRQLTFDLARDPSLDPEDFLVAPSNAAAHAIIERWPDWPERLLLLQGPKGAGKSHLGAIWAARSSASIVRRPDRLDPRGCAPASCLFVEDCDRAGYSEDALFHLINRVRETAGWLLISARTSPDAWGLRVKDLLSRLRLAPVAEIGRPDPGLIRAVIVKLFADRQIRIDEDVVSYAALHCEQSLDAVGRFVAAVDNEALASGRRITRPLASRALAILQDVPD